MSIIKDRKRKVIHLGYSSTKSQWNFENDLPNYKHPHATELKQVIKSKKLSAEKAILKLDNLRKPYTVKDIAHMINERLDSSSFKSYTEQEIEVLKKEKRDKYAKSFNDALNAILKFNNGVDLDFKEITPKFCRDFESYLITNDCKVNTIATYMIRIRAIYNRAIKDRLISKHFYPFEEYRIKTEKTQKRAVQKNIIGKIKRLKLKLGSRKYIARDLFMFSFYNRGINFKDILFLKEKDIINGRIYYRRSKVKEPINVKLLPESRRIINKYIKSLGPDEYIFPYVKKGDEFNSYETAYGNLRRELNEIGKEVGCPFSLTSYVARHSWATIAKRSGVSASVISEALGHQTEKTTQIYLDSFEDDVVDEANRKITRL